ncbi:SigE family RNA polymerase sigma factor [Streptomyces mirabilis]|uniref:SigE family RNA polymerase sigma factor n=1 Tax=Streptomyces mirabilis TaxID=68239 RepID=UPI002B1CACDD|nr:SigE family RNA polymerase sigma factor [Streptomyces mirabilis]
MRIATIPAAPLTAVSGRRDMWALVHILVRVGADRMRRAQDWFALRSPTGRQGAWGAPPDVVSPSGTAAGDEPGFNDLYKHRRLALVRLALLLVDDLPTAEDVVQDAIAALLRRHGRRLADLDDPEAYLRTSVVNTARSVLRRRRTARAYIPERERHAASADKKVLLAEIHQEVIDALHRLTQRQREVLVLRYWSDLTETEIADALGVSRGTVKSTASRALDALRRQLEIPR